MRVRPGDIRTKRELGGGTLYDIGVYCINAARYLFRAEPTEVLACSVNSDPGGFPKSTRRPRPSFVSRASGSRAS